MSASISCCFFDAIDVKYPFTLFWGATFFPFIGPKLRATRRFACDKRWVKSLGVRKNRDSPAVAKPSRAG